MRYKRIPVTLTVDELDRSRPRRPTVYLAARADASEDETTRDADEIGIGFGDCSDNAGKVREMIRRQEVVAVE